MDFQVDDTQRLIEASQNRDHAAFGRLVHLHQNYAYRIAWRMLGNEQDCRDIVQESFIRIWQSIARFRKNDRFTTWLYRIVINCALDRIRQRKRRKESPLEHCGNPADETLSAHDLIEQRETADFIAKEARKLPEKQRLVFILRDMEDKTVDETALILKMTKGAVKSHLCHARKKIRQRLEANNA